MFIHGWPTSRPCNPISSRAGAQYQQLDRGGVNADEDPCPVPELEGEGEGEEIEPTDDAEPMSPDYSDEDDEQPAPSASQDAAQAIPQVRRVAREPFMACFPTYMPSLAASSWTAPCMQTHLTPTWLAFPCYCERMMLIYQPLRWLRAALTWRQQAAGALHTSLAHAPHAQACSGSCLRLIMHTASAYTTADINSAPGRHFPNRGGQQAHQHCARVGQGMHPPRPCPAGLPSSLAAHTPLAHTFCCRHTSRLAPAASLHPGRASLARSACRATRGRRTGRSRCGYR
jgi:hypothetical protein